MRVVRLLPLIVPVAMAAVFTATVRRWGPHRGYLYGFGAYWAACLAIPIAILDRHRFAELFTWRSKPLPQPRILAAAVLALPPAGAIAAELLPNIKTADAKVVGASMGIATVNAVAEEMLWRGVPVTEFPDDAWNGWLLPATGFTLWHLVPIAARGRWSRSVGVLAGAALIGFGYGWIAWKTRSLRWTIPPHIVTDASGLRSVRRVWLGGSED